MAITTEIGDLVDSVFGAVNVINSEVAEREKKKADYDLAIMSNQLQYEAKRKFQEVQQNNQYDSWQSAFDGNMESIASQMEDSRSPYYCRNRYMAERMNLAIDNVRQEYKARLYQAAEVKQHDERIVKYNEAKSRNAENLTGQALIDANNSLARGLLEAGDIDPTQYQNETMQNFYVGTMTNITNNFSNDIIDAAIKGNMTFDETYEKYSKNLEDTKYYGYDGLEVAVDKKDVTEKAKKQCEQMFNNRLYAIQTENYQYHSQQLTDIESAWGALQNGDASQLGLIKRIATNGLNVVDKQGGNQLQKGEQPAIAKKYNNWLEVANNWQAAQNGDKAAQKKVRDNFDPKSLATYMINAWKRGDESNLGGPATGYDTEKIYNDTVLEEYRQHIGNPNATWAQLEKDYPVVGELFDMMEKNMPPEFNSLISDLKNTVQTSFSVKGESKAWEPLWFEIEELVKDTIYETNLSDIGPAERKEIADRLKKNINSMYGQMLGQKSKELKTLSNFREGVFNKEKTLAKAMEERDANKDLVYTNKNGVPKEMGSKEVKEGLTYVEAAEKKMLKDKLGLTDEQTKQIGSHYEEDGIHDVSARKIYTVNGMDYRFHSDGKGNVVMESKKNGTTDWQVEKTAAQEKEDNKPENVVDRYIKAKDISKLPPIDKKIPVGGGRFMQLNQSLWETRMDKKQLLLEWYQRDPEAAEAYFNSLPERQKEENPIKDRKKK